MKTIEINGVTFEVHKSKAVSTVFLDRYAGRTINDCYERPSYSKTYIYNNWLEWATNAGVEQFGISGYNGFQFTLQGKIEIDGITYILHITKSANKAYIIE